MRSSICESFRKCECCCECCNKFTSVCWISFLHNFGLYSYENYMLHYDLECCGYGYDGENQE